MRVEVQNVTRRRTGPRPRHVPCIRRQEDAVRLLARELHVGKATASALLPLASAVAARRLAAMKAAQEEVIQ